MLNQVAITLLDLVVQPFVAILLLRFHMQWLNIPMRNPVGEFIMALTNFIVLPLRKRMPALWKLDSACLLLALIGQLLYLSGLQLANGLPLQIDSLPGLALLASIKLCIISIYLLMVIVFIQAILSWIAPHSPIAPVLHAITQPFLGPIRRLIPLVGPVDLSAMVLFIACYIALIPVNQLALLALTMV